MTQGTPAVSVICPFYNEAEGVALFLQNLFAVLDSLDCEAEVICINDGSTDATLEELKRFKAGRAGLRILNLSRNFGKEAALTAGLDYAAGDYVIPIDTDLEDPPELIPQMLTLCADGHDVVLARRKSRRHDSLLKRSTARWFYKIFNRLSDVPLEENAGDYRCMSRRVVEAIRRLPEKQRFMKGIFAWVGFDTTVLEYDRDARQAGSSKFSKRKLWKLAVEGVTSFSTVPLSAWLYIGSVISLLAFLYASFIVIRTLILGVDMPGYASLITVVLFLGGIQLIGIGVLGEYIGRVYMESKSRPVYIVKDEY